ncbi:nucleotidyltransferase domain-containing protein [Halorubrum ezzemoulense]|uniref:nucleotidyltransferase domain-containing protein n=1 Tax=Halorubrum ezzemoulense TaxID=337243 RepID=UPI00233137FE|nr:nucleotidyltransferase domain-containing protein [Halorubrum ezzemoulense]MDB9234957.1 nucleotidyltransferase domain-containing protein [Halorubrum ezzemoulense]MDB9253918.1 nucleotidyltransferase domain-containing protein [Halorubrum ezzemoulense]MDB9257112.1 nucleotidyltransferase domain-containing protein [Halorubrum ezzemoulense]MDB9277922.1 nucleotidyltransferase domain-containing protein [Halorubrum ezzemoulense]
METDTNSTSVDGIQISIDLPLQDDRLLSGDATADILLFLTRHHDESFSITNLADAIGYTRPTITKTVDTLSRNDLVIEEHDGPLRLVQINRDRLTIPDDPFLGIPQSEFHAPVQDATDQLRTKLDDVLAVVLYGSVARGEADRRSDIDIWVLVREDRPSNQRQANHIRQSLEEDTFGGDRYAFDIDVEALQGIPTYAEELQEILHDGITVYQTDEFDTVRSMILHGNG